MLDWGLLPMAISSRIFSKINTLASTAIPKVSTIPAIPGKVRVACSNDNNATNITTFISKAKLAIMPKVL